MGAVPTQTTTKVMASKWSAWHPSPKAQGTSWKRREKDCKTWRPKAVSSAYGWATALMSSQLLGLPTWDSHKVKQQIISINQKCIKAINKSLDRMLGTREEEIYKLSISEIGDVSLESLQNWKINKATLQITHVNELYGLRGKIPWKTRLVFLQADKQMTWRA